MPTLDVLPLLVEVGGEARVQASLLSTAISWCSDYKERGGRRRRRRRLPPAASDGPWAWAAGPRAFFVSRLVFLEELFGGRGWRRDIGGLSRCMFFNGVLRYSEGGEVDSTFWSLSGGAPKSGSAARAWAAECVDNLCASAGGGTSLRTAPCSSRAVLKRTSPSSRATLPAVVVIDEWCGRSYWRPGLPAAVARDKTTRRERLSTGSVAERTRSAKATVLKRWARCKVGADKCVQRF